METIYGRMTARGFVVACPDCGKEWTILLPGGLEATREALSTVGRWGWGCTRPRGCGKSFYIQLAPD